MPKMKTHKGSAKRLKRTGTGKLKRASAGRRHLLGAKTAKRKRNLRGGGMVHETDLKRYTHMIP